MSEKSLWERIVELTITVGERILAPVERFIGKLRDALGGFQNSSHLYSPKPPTPCGGRSDGAS